MAVNLDARAMCRRISGSCMLFTVEALPWTLVALSIFVRSQWCLLPLGTRHAVAQSDIASAGCQVHLEIHLKGADTIVFTDNDIVDAALVSELGGRTWITRVPSASNPADYPSMFRGDLLKEWLPLDELSYP
eukprot:831439-Amphidinium_carterae.1